MSPASRGAAAELGDDTADSPSGAELSRGPIVPATRTSCRRATGEICRRRLSDQVRAYVRRETKSRLRLPTMRIDKNGHPRRSCLHQRGI
jgi:hypothetical protein